MRERTVMRGMARLFWRDPKTLPRQVLFGKADISTLLRHSLSGSGGTEMMKAIRASLAPSDAPGRCRVVCFMTDGEVGNDLEILAEVQRHPNARVFAFGIGSSVNHFLLDGM